MDWKIERIRDRCTTCSQPFQHDQRVVSVIEIDLSDRIVRRDLCSSCGSTPTARSVWWEARFEIPTQKKRRVDFNRLLRIFEAWQPSPPKNQEALLYLITLLLVRKRFLRLVDLVSEGGREFLRLRRPGPAERTFLAPAPLLAPADLPALRARLEELIDGSFEEDEMPTSPDAAAAAV